MSTVFAAKSSSEDELSSESQPLTLPVSPLRKTRPLKPRYPTSSDELAFLAEELTAHLTAKGHFSATHPASAATATAVMRSAPDPPKAGKAAKFMKVAGIGLCVVACLPAGIFVVGAAVVVAFVGKTVLTWLRYAAAQLVLLDSPSIVLLDQDTGISLPAFGGVTYVRPKQNALGQLLPTEGPSLQRITVEEQCKREINYFSAKYQYATSGRPLSGMSPAAVIFVANDDDIKQAILYARAAKVAIAVRSGGHQYCGFSSTGGKNIQLDLSGRLHKSDTPYPYHRFEYNAAQNLITAGCGLDLLTLHEKMMALGLFVPHGECKNVHIGGHAQTGGYGALTRPFGLFVDYIQSFDIIGPDAQKRTIRRDTDDAEEAEWFFAVLGGSPGNFGVITSVTIRPLRDADHPNARGMKLAFPYTKERLEALLQIVAEHADNDSLPADYVYTVFVISAHKFFSVSENIDSSMKRHHPELFGQDKELVPSCVIGVCGCWVNLRGADEQYDSSVFQKIKDAAGPQLANFEGFTEVGGAFDDKRPHPISWMLDRWIYRDTREFCLPGLKRLWMTNKRGLSDNGWANWAAQSIEDIQAPHLNGLKIAAQFMPFSNPNCKFRNPPDNKTSVAWRDSTCFSALDAFYNEEIKTVNPWATPKEDAERWCTKIQQEGVGPRGRFSKDDRRLIWAPFGPDFSLDRTHHAYYDNEDVYQRLLAFKRRVDPDRIFSPNEFCVGFSEQQN